MQLERDKVYEVREGGAHIRIVCTDAPIGGDDEDRKDCCVGVCVKKDDRWDIGETGTWNPDGTYGVDAGRFDLVAEARTPRRFNVVIDGKSVLVEEVLS